MSYIKVFSLKKIFTPSNILNVTRHPRLI